MTLLATEEDMEFTGNYIDNNSVITYNAIYNNVGADGATSTINFVAIAGNSIIVNDQISGGCCCWDTHTLFCCVSLACW